MALVEWISIFTWVIQKLSGLIKINLLPVIRQPWNFGNRRSRWWRIRIRKLAPCQKNSRSIYGLRIVHPTSCRRGKSCSFHQRVEIINIIRNKRGGGEIFFENYVYLLSLCQNIYPTFSRNKHNEYSETFWKGWINAVIVIYFSLAQAHFRRLQCESIKHKRRSTESTFVNNKIIYISLC